MRRAAVLLALAVLAACRPAPDIAGSPTSSEPNAAGLVSLPCDGSEPLAPLKPRYCRQRHFLTPLARDALIDAARALAARHTGAVLHFMDASGPEGVTPFPPHLSHGDGRQIDVALFFETLEGRPLSAPPDTAAHGGWWPAEPPRHDETVACPQGRVGPAQKPDPPADRNWRMDEARTKALVEILIADPRVRRILIEPHLERRFDLWDHPKLRFAGCRAARHDDHLHIDFH